jgi:peptidoglycan hydrolase-like protein with peptidoglycan-binding domain
MPSGVGKGRGFSVVRGRAVSVAAVAGLVALVSLVAGCGGGGDDDSSDATTTTIGGSATSTPTSVASVTSVAPTVLPATTALPIPDAAGYMQEPAEGTLRQGMKGLRVQALQAKLIALGYDPGTADGLFGARTKAAVQKFQTDKGLVADGIVGPLTQAALG